MKLRDHGTHFYNRILQLLNLFVLLYEQLSLQCENTALSSKSLFREVMKDSEGLGDLRLIWLTVTKFERSICCVKVRLDNLAPLADGGMDIQVVIIAVFQDLKVVLV
jgi:hypothetical protein